MERPIHAVVIDGFHEGHVVRLPYSPTIRLLKPKTVTVDTCCPGYDYFVEEHKILEYKEVMRAVDLEVVFYSTTGKSMEIIAGNMFQHVFSGKPWTSSTTLYFGYHDGLIKRED